jgi:uncharacterized protein YggE
MNKKRLWLAVLAAVLIVPTVILTGCAGTTGGANGSPVNVNLNGQQEGIWVNGQGKVTVTPDVANVSIGVEAQSSSVSTAQGEAAIAMDEVVTALTKNGVAKKDIQTQYFNISKVTRWDDNNQKEIVLGYRVSNMVTAKIKDIEKTGEIIDAVAVAGGDLIRINGINFTVEDPTVYQEEARDKAMADAEAKAKQMANLAKVKLGKPTYISENTYYPPVPVYRGGVAMEAAGPPPTSISPGELDITLNVQVVYTILE